MEYKAQYKDPWWLAKKEHLATRLFKTIKDLDRKQSQRSNTNLLYYKLQNHQSLVGPNSENISSSKLYDRLTLNIIKQTTESLIAKLLQEEVKGMFITDAGNYYQQENAKKLEELIDGQIYLTKHNEMTKYVAINAATFGRGYLKSWLTDGKLKTEWVLSEKIKYDEDECLLGKPVHLYQVEFIDKLALIEKYPAFREKIMQAEGLNTQTDHFFCDLLNYNESKDNYVKVIEGWRLGRRHSICISNATIIDEPYPKDYFPFSTFSIYDRIGSCYGEGISERLLFNQYEINKTLRTIGKIIHIGCIPKVFIDSSGDIKSSALNNSIGSIIKYTGQKPEQGQLLKVPVELWEHLNFFVNNSYKETGQAEFLVSGEKPKGTYSAKAQNEYLSTVEGRMYNIIKNFQQFNMDTYELWLKLFQDDVQNVSKLTALGPNGFKIIDWKRIKYETEKFVYKMYPANLLSKHPASRRTEIAEMMNIGLFDRDQSIDLLDYPDIKKVTNNEIAPRKLIQKIIAKIIEEGAIFRANEDLFLEEAIPMVVKACAYYQTMDMPPENLPLLEDFRDELVQFRAIQEQRQIQLMQQQMAEQSLAQENAKAQGQMAVDENKIITSGQVDAEKMASQNLLETQKEEYLAQRGI